MSGRVSTPEEKYRRHRCAGSVRPLAQVFVTRYVRCYEVTMIVGAQMFGLMRFAKRHPEGGLRRAQWYAAMLRKALTNAGARVALGLPS